MGACSTKSARTRSPRASEDNSDNRNGGAKDGSSSVSPREKDSIKTAVESGVPGKPNTGKSGGKQGEPDARGLAVSETRRRRLSVIPQQSNEGEDAAVQTTIEDCMNEKGERLLAPVQLGAHKVLHSIAGLSAAGMEPGYNKTNQDFICMQPLEAPEGQDQSFMFAVLDGHGTDGHHVSKLASTCISDAVAKAAMVEDMAGHLWETFRDVNTFLVKDSGIDCTFSGATATVSVLNGARLTSAWVGDSRAVLGRREGGTVRAYDLSTDHKPDLPEEVSRIEAAGGRIEPLMDELNQPIGPPRVWLADSWMPGLAMSRSLGDTLAASCGVSSCPDVSVVDITPADVCVIWASDGVWEFMSSQDAIDTVVGCGDAAEAAAVLVQAAQQHWRTHEVSVSDDISAVIAIFNQDEEGAGEAVAAPEGESEDT